MCRSPVLSRLPTAIARPTSVENTPAERPYSLWLASCTASSSLPIEVMAATLLVEGAHARLHAGEHGRLVERSVECSAGFELGAGRDRVVDDAVNALHLRLVDHRPERD